MGPGPTLLTGGACRELAPPSRAGRRRSLLVLRLVVLWATREQSPRSSRDHDSTPTAPLNSTHRVAAAIAATARGGDDRIPHAAGHPACGSAHLQHMAHANRGLDHQRPQRPAPAPISAGPARRGPIHRAPLSHRRSNIAEHKFPLPLTRMPKTPHYRISSRQIAPSSLDSGLPSTSPPLVACTGSDHEEERLCRREPLPKKGSHASRDLAGETKRDSASG